MGGERRLKEAHAVFRVEDEAGIVPATGDFGEMGSRRLDDLGVDLYEDERFDFGVF